MRRTPSLIAWVVLVAMAAGTRAIRTSMVPAAGYGNIVVVQLLLTFVSVAVGGLLVFLLGRALLASHTGHARPLYGRFIGLFVTSSLLTGFITTTAAVIIFAGVPTPFMATYGSILVGSLAAILVFPIVVRNMAAAAGSPEPKLPGMIGFDLADGRFAYAWYALCAIVFPAMVVFTFANLLPSDNTANQLPANIVQSLITGTGALLRYLVAIVAARGATPGMRQQAEAFA
jgi:hypothetical protein